MPASYRLLPQHGVAHVKFSGHVAMNEVSDCLEAFGNDPDGRTTLKHIVDFSTVTSYDHDFVKIIELQAQMASVFLDELGQWVFAYYAPTKLSREMANYSLRAWEGETRIVIRMTETEADTLDIMGIPHRTLGALLEGATPI